jgi:hypothetical protein
MRIETRGNFVIKKIASKVHGRLSIRVKFLAENIDVTINLGE